MRIYPNFKEAIVDIARELKKCSTEVHTQTMQNKQIADNPDFNTREIQAFAFTVIDTSDKDEMPGITLEWCKKEFDERTDPVGPINPGEAYLLRRDVWDEFLVNGKFEYTYNERMHWQLWPVTEELIKHPETRQAIIQLHQREIDQERMGKKRIPCSMTYSFMIRDGKLDIIYYMRSTDFATHFQNDLWLAASLQKHIADRIDRPVGKFIFFANSLHLYQKDWDKLINY